MSGTRSSRPAHAGADRRPWIGHTSYVLASGSAKLYIQSDVTNNPDLFARNPGWSASFDQDAAQAVATRRKVYDMLVAEKMLVQGFHYPFRASPASRRRTPVIEWCRRRGPILKNDGSDGSAEPLRSVISRAGIRRTHDCWVENRDHVVGAVEAL